MGNLGNKKVFSENLLYYIRKSGRNQKEIAEAIEVSTSTLNDWVQAKSFPRIDKIEKLAMLFRIRKSDLIEEKSISDNPVEMAERHFEMIMDEDVNEIFEAFRSLDAGKKKIVKDLIRSLAEIKTEA